MVVVEQGQKLAWVPVVPLEPAPLERGQAVFDVFQVEHRQIHCGPLADRRRLGRLHVGQAETRQVAVLLGEPAEPIDHRHQPRADQRQGLAHQEQVRVVGHVTARGAEVNDPAGRRAGVAVGVDVRHHVMAHGARAGRRESMSSRWAFNSAICPAVTASPNSASASASATHRRRQVLNLRCGLQISLMRGEA